MQIDFVVIGSGLAGLTSALNLSKWGKVLIVTKGEITQGSTGWAQGGIACAVLKADSANSHVKDTLIAGANHNNINSVKFLVKHSKLAISWLEKQGVKFDRNLYGGFSPGLEAGHSFPRIIHTTDFTGKIVEDTLIKRIRTNKSIAVRDQAFAVDLLVSGGECRGIVIIQNRKIDSIVSRAVVLATGGLGQLYHWTTNPSVSTGDGIALAYRAGAKISDLEFIQFHPTAFKYGSPPLFLLSEALRGEGGYLVKIKVKSEKLKVNVKSGERFMQNVDKREELAPRDIVSRAIVSEQIRGYEVYLDIRHRGKDFLKKRFPNIFKKLKENGFDLSCDLIPVTPAAHYSCGGVRVDLFGRSSIKNLFAFGEVACTGVHGANRLASNSLLEAVVFPLQISRIKKEFVQKTAQGALFKSDERIIETENNIGSVKQKLKKLMWEKAGIVRSLPGLKFAYQQIIRWEKDYPVSRLKSPGLCELQNMLLTSRLIVESALKRKNSLGSHYIKKS